VDGRTLPPETTNLATVTETSTTTSPGLGSQHGPTLLEPTELVQADDALAAASANAQDTINQCGIETPSCIADALDAYADAVEKLAPQLPPRLRTLPAILHNAAKNVRAAKTIAQARKAVKVAISQVHKIISLQIADDRASGGAPTRDGALVVETLRVADVKLEKASGL
jgi:hypothetical protein